MAAEKLRDLSHPIDVALLDATVAAFYGTGSKEEVRACSPSTFLQLLFGLLGGAGKWWGIRDELGCWLGLFSSTEYILERSVMV